VIKPKVLGGWNLHSATSGLELDHFVLFSSATTLYGNPGQGAYVAGNVFLEQLAVLRRLERNVGTAISLGPIADSGVIRDNGKVQGILKRQGWTPLATSRALDLLGQALSRAPVHRALLHIDWSEFARAFPQASGGSRLGALTGAGSKAQAPQERGLRETLASLSRHEGAALLQGQLQSSLAGILGLAADKIDPRTSLGNLGLDSLMATQLSNWIKSHVKVSYPVMKLMEGPSIAELTRRLMSEVETDAEKPAIVSTASQPWILRPRRKENPAIRLFCFPYTGAGASVYRTWADTLPDEYELCCIQPPGREERRQEFPAVLPEDFFPHLLEAMKPLLDRPFACYGHSMGGPMCYTLCSRIHDAFQVAPVALFVGATASPGKSNVFRDLFTMLRPHTTNPAAALPDEQLVEFLRRVGAPLDLASQVVLREVLPVVRADILLRNAIDYREVVKLPCPIYAISADGDDVYDAEAVDSWKDVTTVEFALRRITGRHLFLHDAAASATAIDWIVSKLRSRMS
jgi:surfactin synthase thioesterase subunit/aryl carrier-like protein